MLAVFYFISDIICFYLILLLSGADRDRTGDLLNAIQTRSQLRHSPLWRSPECFRHSGLHRPGGDWLSHGVAPAVSLASLSLTAEFGMGSGVSSRLLPPGKLFITGSVKARPWKYPDFKNIPLQGLHRSSIMFLTEPAKDKSTEY